MTGQLTYSVTEAVRYAEDKIAYCDTVLSSSETASFRRLRSHAHGVLMILSTTPENRGLLHEILEDLRFRRSHEGMAWIAFTDYLERYLEHQTQQAWRPLGLSERDGRMNREAETDSTDTGVPRPRGDQEPR